MVRPEIGPFTQVGLTEDNCTGIAELFYNKSVLLRMRFRQCQGTGGSSHFICRINVVLLSEPEFHVKDFSPCLIFFPCRVLWPAKAHQGLILSHCSIWDHFYPVFVSAPDTVKPVFFRSILATLHILL